MIEEFEVRGMAKVLVMIPRQEFRAFEKKKKGGSAQQDPTKHLFAE